jgi:cysteinyl-tRNA synthetase
MKFDRKRLNSIRMKLERNTTESNKVQTEDVLWAFDELDRSWKELEKTYGAEESFPGVSQTQYRSDVDILNSALDEASSLAGRLEIVGKLFKEHAEATDEEMRNLTERGKRVSAKIQDRLKEVEKLVKLAS